MAEVLGNVMAVGLEAPLDPAQLVDVAIEYVTKRCLDYQLQFRVRDEDKRKLDKYSKLLGVDLLHELADPQYLIPPYFEMSGTDDPWASINLRSIGYSQGFADGVPIRPVFHVRSFQQVDDAMLESYLDLDVDEISIYPNNFKEHDASENELISYRDVIRKFAGAGNSTHAMFGGYFAILMNYFGLAGFGNGVGYGEWRDSGYHKGGTPSIRLYVPRLHRFMDPPIAQSLLDQNSYFGGEEGLLADCANNGRPLTEITQEEALDHFMECRAREIEFVQGNPVGTAVGELQQTVDALDAVGIIESRTYGRSLKRWIDVIEE